MRESAKTFCWLVRILQARSVPFVVTGGLAAKSYGCARALNDIDIDILTTDFPKILEDIRPYLTYGPARFTDERWDLTLAILNHHEQIVDIGGGDDIKLFDDKRQNWISASDDFSNTVMREIFGCTVAVVSPQHLIAYKSLLTGEHQRLDIAAAEDFLRKK